MVRMAKTLSLSGPNQVVDAKLDKAVTQLHFVRAKEAVIRDLKRTGTAFLVDYGVDVLRIVRSDLGKPGPGAALINGRYGGFKRVEIQESSLHDSDSDLLHFGAGYYKEGNSWILPPVTGYIKDTIFQGVTEGAHKPHADAVQVATSSQDLLWERVTFKGTRSSYQVTPLQNGAKRPGTGSGESTGYGVHRHMILREVTLDNAGTARFFNCPDLELYRVIQFGRGVFDIRFSQIEKPIPGKPFRKHPDADKTRRVSMRECSIERMALDPQVVFDEARCGNNKIKTLVDPVGKPFPRDAENRVRKILERRV